MNINALIKNIKSLNINISAAKKHNHDVKLL